LFGPWEDLKENVEKYLIEGGFCGFIRGPEAEKLVKKEGNSLCLRFSRKNPLCLAVSFSDDEKKAKTVTNNKTYYDRKEEASETYPIKRLLEHESIPINLRCVDLKFNCKNRKLELSDYAWNCNYKTGSKYYVQSNQNLEASASSADEEKDIGNYIAQVEFMGKDMAQDIAKEEQKYEKEKNIKQSGEIKIKSVDPFAGYSPFIENKLEFKKKKLMKKDLKLP